MGTRAPDPSESLPALSAQVADLHGQVTGMKARMDHYGLSGDLAATGAVLGELTGVAGRLDEVAELAAAVRRDLDDAVDEGRLPAITAPRWDVLDAAGHEQMLAELAGWVDGFLRVTYPHTGLRSCWPDHPALLWELSTLRAEWRRVYDRRHPELAGALAWHDRWLPGAQTRIAAVLVDCKGGCALVRSPTQLRPQPQPRAG